jgi:hypothetical protein
MTEDQDKNLHPVVERALEMAYEGIEPIQFDDYAVEQLEDLLKEYYGRQDLIEAVVQLLHLAVLLDEQGCKKASLKMIIVATSATEAVEALSKRKHRNMAEDGV